MARFVLMDPKVGSAPAGFVVNDPMEGWVFTYLFSNAMRFATQAEAEQAKGHFTGRGAERLKVLTVE